MKYFEIKQDTKEYESADKVYTWAEDWMKDEVNEDWKQLLGYDPDNMLEMNPHCLRVVSAPVGMETQFKKRLVNGRYEARATSDINKKYLKIVKKHDLKIYSVTEFAFQFGLGNIRTLCPIITKEVSRYFLEMKSDLSDGILKRFQDHPALSEIQEYEYLQIRAEMLREKHGISIKP